VLKMVNSPDIDSILAGNRLAVSRALSRVEDQTEEGAMTLSALFPFTGKAYLIGITGSPGTGKSTLTAQLARLFRKPPFGNDPMKVGILAVDPTSPFSGGAVLGDRVRMRDLAGDDGVFIRSMASRGVLGGLSLATSAAADILDAAGFSIILIETVGAGQDDVSIASLAHTVVVVESPDLGDDIQAIKAGILEIADVLVLNKADLNGVARAERALRNALDLADTAHTYYGKVGHQEQPVNTKTTLSGSWLTPLIKTVATNGEGVQDLYSAILDHKEYISKNDIWLVKSEKRLTEEMNHLLRDALFDSWWGKISEDRYQRILGQVLRHELSPYQAVEMFLKQPK
jgi:LAO/AO transport system kinase